jgi:hypothetical protein
VFAEQSKSKSKSKSKRKKFPVFFKKILLPLALALALEPVQESQLRKPSLNQEQEQEQAVFFIFLFLTRLENVIMSSSPSALKDTAVPCAFRQRRRYRQSNFQVPHLQSLCNFGAELCKMKIHVFCYTGSKQFCPLSFESGPIECLRAPETAELEDSSPW